VNHHACLGPVFLDTVNDWLLSFEAEVPSPQVQLINIGVALLGAVDLVSPVHFPFSSLWLFGE
jgi:hypothetical protein